jgi:predicted O-methyltransferase YrrM
MKTRLFKSLRYLWLPIWARVRRERDVHPHHVSEERAELFDAYNETSTELEILNWLYSCIRAFKPSVILETGAANGLGTIAMATACKQNGFGVVHSLEIEPATCRSLERKLAFARLSPYAEIHCGDSLSFLEETDCSFDFAFFDSRPEFRWREFGICLERNLIQKIAVFHDTSPHRSLILPGLEERSLQERYRAELMKFASDPRCTGYFESKLSRGLYCLFLKEQPRIS